MYTIKDVINSAFRKAGITAANGMRQPTPDMLDIGFEEYKEMMLELAPILRLDTTDLSSAEIDYTAGFQDSAMSAISYELGKRIAPIYQVMLTDSYMDNARESMENLQVLLISVPELKRRADMPKGQGWKDWGYIGPFYPHTGDDC